MDKKKIFYILGAGRSGTTLLEIILGNSPSIFNTGEVNHFPHLRGIPRKRNADSVEGKFWKTIRVKIAGIYNFYQLNRLHKKYEYHTSLILHFLGIAGKDKITYDQYLIDFYNLIYDHSDSNVITDSSKYPGRALNISRVLDYDISYIYIIRNPIDVVRSFAKKGVEQASKNWFSANLYYFVINALCKLTIRVLSTKHKVSKVIYDDLINEPLNTLEKLEKDLEVDLSAIKRKISGDEYLNISPYLFDGNRSRLDDKLKIRKKKQYKKLSSLDKLTKFINSPFY